MNDPQAHKAAPESPVPRDCDFSRCSKDCDCWLPEFIQWPHDQQVALIARYGPRAVLTLATSYMDETMALKETLHAIQSAAEQAECQDDLASIISALLECHRQREQQREATRIKVIGGGAKLHPTAEPVPVAHIPYDKAAEIGVHLRRHLADMTGANLPHHDDLAWADMVQMILHRAKS